MNGNTEVKAYTTEEVQDILKITKRTLYNYIKNNQIKAIKLGRSWRITEDALKDFLERGTDKNYLTASRQGKNTHTEN